MYKGSYCSCFEVIFSVRISYANGVVVSPQLLIIFCDMVSNSA